MSCCICNNKLSGYGHNAEPVMEGECCDTCNSTVISARLNKHSTVDKESAELADVKQRLKRLENQFQHFISSKQKQEKRVGRELLKLRDKLIDFPQPLLRPCKKVKKELEEAGIEPESGTDLLV